MPTVHECEWVEGKEEHPLESSVYISSCGLNFSLTDRDVIHLGGDEFRYCPKCGGSIYVVKEAGMDERPLKAYEFSGTDTGSSLGIWHVVIIAPSYGAAQVILDLHMQELGRRLISDGTENLSDIRGIVYSDIERHKARGRVKR